VFDPKKDYLYPVPLKEISLTGGAVTQNPGWKATED
jgi:nitrogen fixation protein